MKLTENQKNIRINKILKGTSLVEVEEDKIEEYLKYKDKLPTHSFDASEKHKIMKIVVNDDGSIHIKGIILDGKEDDPRKRSVYSVYYFSDEEAAESEWKHFQKGTLRSVNPTRTKHIHLEKGRWNQIQEKINKGEIGVVI